MMSHQISDFMTRLRQSEQGVVIGCYTPAIIAQLAQSLSRLVFGGNDDVIIVADRDSQRAWAEMALRGISTPVMRVLLTTSQRQSTGFVLIGIGAEAGYGVVATLTDPLDHDDSVRLYDVLWTSDPSVLTALAPLLRSTISQDLLARIEALDNLPSEALLKLSGDLIDFAARQHSTLAVSNRALSERMHNHEDQTRMIVHDMRAPLHTLLISIKALQRQRFDPDGQNELLTVARDSAGYLLNLTETVLDSARLETSAWALKRQPVRLLSLVESVCEPLELAARPDQSRLYHVVDENIPPVMVDRTLIDRVLTNLITNAIKYTPAHGEIKVMARLVHDGHAVELSVSDTGEGIPFEAQAHIFERFYQAKENDRQRGTGLGLYFCRLAVEAHGGSISVKSAVGQGSTFTLLLPINEDEE